MTRREWIPLLFGRADPIMTVRAWLQRHVLCNYTCMQTVLEQAPSYDYHVDSNINFPWSINTFTCHEAAILCTEKHVILQRSLLRGCDLQKYAEKCITWLKSTAGEPHIHLHPPLLYCKSASIGVHLKMFALYKKKKVFNVNTTQVRLTRMVFTRWLTSNIPTYTRLH